MCLADNKELVLFGAGAQAIDFVRLFEKLRVEIVGIADNDPNKAGKFIGSLQVALPGDLLNQERRIFITCIKQKEIIDQLTSIGYAANIISLEKAVSGIAMEGVEISAIADEKVQFVFDAVSGAAWGGAENWNFMVASEIAKKSNTTMLVEKNLIVPEKYRSISLYTVSYDDCFKDVYNFISKDDGKTVYVNSWWGRAFFPALAYKMQHPHVFKIVSVVHLDVPRSYFLCKRYAEYIDCFVCVSSNIAETLVREHGVPSSKVKFLHQPIIHNDEMMRKRERYDGIIRIAIGSRIVKEHKRCDLIPSLVEGMIEHGINFRLDIAGDGPFLPELKKYVEKSKLTEKIKFEGYIDAGKMLDFWRGHDIYINLSEFEGASLAMLEAMREGCVPVVTDVSGVRDYVMQGSNGYISSTRKISDMVNAIVELDKNRRKLQQYGNEAEKTIRRYGCIEDYGYKFLKCVS